jgi:hypothetical protein
LSNCGDVLKAPSPSRVWKRNLVAKGNNLGYGKSMEHEPQVKWIIRSQVLRPTGYGCSSQTK